MTYDIPFQQTQEGCRIDGVDRWEVEVGGERIGLQVTRPRLLPWTRIVRVPRFGRGLDSLAVKQILGRLVRLWGERSVLRLHIEVWSEREADRAAVDAACRRLHFTRFPPRNYTHTVWFDISVPERDLLLSFHRSVRRNIQVPMRKGFSVRPVTDLASIPRISDIFKRTFDRTGGTPPFIDWEFLIERNGEPGCHHHMVGLFPESVASPAEILAFAVVYLHGEVAEFAHAGSVRDSGIRIPLLYAPTWDLIVWAKSQGARFWDFGGVTSSQPGNHDRLAGISKFKLYFCREVVEVGGEWALERHGLTRALARTRSRLS